MDNESKTILFTKARSKGGCLVCAMQALPPDKESFDLITSSTYAYFIFSVKNLETRNYLNEQVGQFDYLVTKTLNNQVQERQGSKKISAWDEVDKLAKDKQHIMYIPEEGALFVGKSDFIKKQDVHEDFIEDHLIDDFRDKLNDEYLSRNDTKSKLENYAQSKVAQSS